MYFKESTCVWTLTMAVSTSVKVHQAPTNACVCPVTH